MSSNLMKKKSAQTLYSLKSLYKFEEDLSLLYQYAQLFIVKHHKVKFRYYVIKLHLALCKHSPYFFKFSRCFEKNLEDFAQN